MAVLLSKFLSSVFLHDTKTVVNKTKQKTHLIKELEVHDMLK
jgi:hypothetical protein